jgi:hypothetical protein
MKRVMVYGLLGFFLVSLCSFSVHKFYMAIYQINFAPEKKMLQITSRIFLDDLNNALTKKYNKKVFLGSDKESVEDVNSLKKYLAENFTIKVNGQTKTMNFLSKEMDGDVLVCYFNCKDVFKITSLEIHNSVLIDWQSEQQNITHVTVQGDKKSILFTDTSTKKVLKY